MVLNQLRTLFRKSKRSANAMQRRLFSSISEEQVDDILTKTFSSNLNLLFVHSSLSRCGHMKSGAEGIIRCLRRHCDTLCLPTHTYCYPVNRVAETYDPRKTLSRIGAITNVFWQSEGVTRSVHPTHSLAGVGPLAEELCRDHHTCETACGSGTPYEKLIEQDAAVLMFGVTMNSYTLFHSAEDAAKCCYLYEGEPYELSVKDFDGTLHTVSLRRQDMTVPRRFTSMREELSDNGLLQIVPFGSNELLYIPSSKQVHQYTTAKLREDEYYLVEGHHDSDDIPADAIEAKETNVAN